MRRGTSSVLGKALGLAIAGPATALILAACGGPDAARTAADGVSAALEGDANLIAAAQVVSDAIGGCEQAADGAAESKVVGLETGAIVMLGCGQADGSATHRVFAAHSDKPPQLLAFPDYRAEGWFATTEVSAAELDAGTGVLTTFRRASEDGGCGSEGEYEWDGARFVTREVRWRACGASNAAPPFPIIWPTQQGASTNPDTATPAP
jgi:hypothetical protein